MDKPEENLSNINKTLERQNEIIQQMLEKMPQHENKFITTLQTIVLIIGALGFINLVDVIINWIGG